MPSDKPNESGQTASSLRDAISSLREAVRLRQIVPVIGPDALTITLDPPSAGDTPRQVPFYRAVAERLLAQYGLSADLLDQASGSWDLHRAVGTVIASQGVSTQRLRRSVSALIRELAESVQPSGLLLELAGLDLFDLYICLTPDDLLQQAIIDKLGGMVEVDVTSYSTRADISQQVDVPAPRKGLVRLFHPLGRAEAATEFAIHEEDALEYLYRFRDEGERRAKILLSSLRQNDRLFLGCSLPDWLGRGLIRLANDQRLSASDRGLDFFCASARDDRLTGFLDRFSPNSIVFPWQPTDFVAELGRLASRTSPAAPGPARAAAQPGAASGNVRKPSAFVSYANEDRDAARRIADALVAAGFGDVWLDQKRLVVGDDWSDRIDSAIEDCDYFVAVLSRQADARREGVFWEEWRKAAARSLRMADAFILPIGIDELPPQQCGYGRIFTGISKTFADLHLIHAPAGRLDADTSAQLQRRVQQFRGSMPTGGDHG